MNVRILIRPLVVFGALAAFLQIAHAQDEQATRMRAALAAPERSQENKLRDAARKPIETVQFLGIRTGDTAVDMIAETGWFTEVLSAAVGPKGHVYMQNPPFLAEREPKDMIARLGNVETLHVQFSEAGLVGKIDDVVTAMNLHDIYNGFGNQAGGEAPAVDFLKAIYAALKPGGVLGLIDHVGIAGQDNIKLHRMLPEEARQLLKKAGFTIEAESKLLANPADDHTKGVFDPAVRGHTDQFMFRARKPR
ncbi:MAG TPA: methyltransferase [Gammaproteobacteria bacterium]|nr:methyltransferase [Gammaproteobacteria bacterium]